MKEDSALTQKLTLFFHQYQQAFNQFDDKKIARFYSVPCCLSLPDSVVFVPNNQVLATEINEIIAQLQQANVVQVTPTKASYTLVSPQLVMACIDWQFIDKSSACFATFSGFYTLELIDDTFKIVQVLSHEIEQSKQLPFDFTINKP